VLRAASGVEREGAPPLVNRASSAIGALPAQADVARPPARSIPREERWPVLPPADAAPAQAHWPAWLDPTALSWPALPPRTGEDAEREVELDERIQELARLRRLDREQKGS
jgi:hypothetical protein